MKKILLGALGLGLALFTGCSRTSGTANTGGEQYTQLTMAFFSGARLDDMALVQEELNKIARVKAGVELTLMPIDWSAWDQQVNLMISGGEKLDLMPVLGENYAAAIGQGKLLPMEQYLSGGAGKALADTVGPVYMGASTVDSHTYGVPSLRDMARSYGLVMRKDLVEKYRIDADSLNTIEDLDRMFAAVKTGEPDMYMIFPQGNWHGIVFQLFHDRDPLGDDLGVLMNRGQGALKVENLYAAAAYARYVRKIREWYLKGYIPQDAITTPDGGNAMIGAGTLFASCANLKPGYAGENSMTMRYDLVQKDFISPYATTRTVTSLMWTLPVTCKNPQKAVDALSLLYTDADFINLIDWGIEGRHYVKVPGSGNVITYPAGVTFDNTGWDMAAGWIFGDQLKSYVWEGNPPDLYEQLDAFNKNALISKAMGFEYDSSPVKTAVATVTNVVSEYRLSLEYGVADPDIALPRFIKAMEDAGIGEIIAEKQRQLDAWAAAQGKR